MFQIRRDDEGTVHLSGILDSSSVDVARETFQKIEASCAVDFKNLEYISSAGLGILLGTQKRLAARGSKLTLVNLPKALLKIFQLAKFDLLFEIKEIKQA